MSDPTRMPSEAIGDSEPSPLPPFVIPRGTWDRYQSEVKKLRNVKNADDFFNLSRVSGRPLPHGLGPALVPVRIQRDEYPLSVRFRTNSEIVLSTGQPTPQVRPTSKYGVQYVAAYRSALGGEDKRKLDHKISRGVYVVGAPPPSFFGRLRAVRVRMENETRCFDNSDESWREAVNRAGYQSIRGLSASLRLPMSLRGAGPGAVRVNMKSRMAPTMERPGETTLPAHQEKAERLAATIYQAYADKGLVGVDELVRAIKNSPDLRYLVTFVAQAKDDFYDYQKLEDLKMRLYAVAPGPLRLIISSVQQSAQQHKRHMLKDSTVTTAQGVPMVRQGADRLVKAVHAQVQRSLTNDGFGFGAAHAGDDSWVVIQFHHDGVIYTISLGLDCNNFDLSQVESLKACAFSAVSEVYSVISPPLTRFCVGVATHAAVCLSSGITTTFIDGSLSGGVFQEVINDTISSHVLDAFRKLLIEAFENWAHDLDDLTEEVAKKLVRQCIAQLSDMYSISIREEFMHVSKGSLHKNMTEFPPTFLGYQLVPTKTAQGMLYLPFLSPERVARAMYSPRHVPKEEFALSEVVRLAGSVLQLGSPARSPPIRAAARKVLAMLKDFSPDQTIPSDLVRYGLNAGAFTGKLVPEDVSLTIAGLQRAIRNASSLWEGTTPLAYYKHNGGLVMEEEPELEDTVTRMIYTDLLDPPAPKVWENLTGWADEAIVEELADESLAAIPEGSAPRGVASLLVSAKDAQDILATALNVGRVPPKRTPLEKSKAMAERAKMSESLRSLHEKFSKGAQKRYKKRDQSLADPNLPSHLVEEYLDESYEADTLKAYNDPEYQKAMEEQERQDEEEEREERRRQYVDGRDPDDDFNLDEDAPLELDTYDPEQMDKYVHSQPVGSITRRGS